MTNYAEDYDVVQPMASFDDGLESIIKEVLQVPLDNAIPLAIYQAGATTWQQFMYIDEDDVFDIEYEAADGTAKYLTKYEQKLLSWFIGYVRENIDNNIPGSEDPSFYTKEDFTKYTQDRRKLRRFKSRYGASVRMERDCGERRRTLEENFVELANKVKKCTNDILEQIKEVQRKHQKENQKATMPKEKVPVPEGNVPVPEDDAKVNETAAPSA